MPTLIAVHIEGHSRYISASAIVKFSCVRSAAGGLLDCLNSGTVCSVTYMDKNKSSTRYL